MEIETRFRLVSAALFVGAMAVSIRYRHRAEKAGGRVSYAAEPLALRIPLRLSGLVFLGSYLAWLAYPESIRWASLPIPPAWRWAAAGVGAVSIPLMWWVFHSLGLNVTRTVVTRQRHTLVTHGPYRWVRHPLYTVGFMSWFGLGILMANALPLTAFLGMLALVKRTAIEEALLRKRFGARYRRYMARTGRFLPRVSMPRRLLR